MLSFPTDKNLKDCVQHIVAMYIVNSCIAVNVCVCSGVGSVLLKFVQAS